MGLIPKFIKKLKPLKILGKAVSIAIPPAAPIVGTIDAAIKAAKGQNVQGPPVFEAAATGAIQGAIGNIQTQVGQSAGKTALEKYALPGAVLLAGGVVALVVLTRRR